MKLKPKVKPIATKEQMMATVKAILEAPKGKELSGILKLGDREVGVGRTDRMALIMISALLQEYGSDFTLEDFALATMEMQWWFAEQYIVLDQAPLPTAKVN